MSDFFFRIDSDFSGERIDKTLSDLCSDFTRSHIQHIIDDGEVKVLGKARGSKNGRNLLSEQVEKAGGIDFAMPVALGYAGLSDKLLRKYIEDSKAIWEPGFPDGQLPVHSVGATIGTHVGPGAIALAFFTA